MLLSQICLLTGQCTRSSKHGFEALVPAGAVSAIELFLGGLEISRVDFFEPFTSG